MEISFKAADSNPRLFVFSLTAAAGENFAPRNEILSPPLKAAASVYLWIRLEG
jgi:hypothetical protein